MIKKYKVFILSIAVVSIAAILMFYNVLKPEEKLPIYQPNMVSFQLVDSTVQHVKRFHKIKDFSLVNQNGEKVTNEDYRDKIYIADFFFTTCQGICPIMKENMIIPEYSLVVGIPGKIVKTLDSKTYDHNIKWAAKYVQLAKIHKENKK